MRTITEPMPSQSIMLWYGGKSKLLAWILPVIRAAMTGANAYVEPYLGGGSVWFALAPNTPTIALNDADPLLMAFYRAVQRRTFTHDWTTLRFIPYARASFLQRHRCDDYHLWVQQTQGISGTPVSNSGSWGRAFITRYGVAARVSYYLKSMRMLATLHTRLQTVRLSCTDALDIIREYDSPNTIFYLDPPYPLHTRMSRVVYRVEADDAHHHALVEILLQIQGRAVLSGYPTPLYKPLEQHGWRRIERAVQTSASIPKQTRHRSRERTEVLWTNA